MPPTGYSSFPWQTVDSYNKGNTIWTSGNIDKPDSGAPYNPSAMVAKLTEEVAGMFWFVHEGGMSDVYIVGNGTPPAGGYTPTTNPIILKGTGLEMQATLKTARVRRELTQPLTAAYHLVDVADGSHYELASPGASSYTIDLDQTTALEGDFVRLSLLDGATSPGGYIIRNSVSLVEIAGMKGYHADITGAFATTAEFEFDGTNWVWCEGDLGTVRLP